MIEPERYGPFNLILWRRAELHFVSNRNASGALADGVHVFSNNLPGLQWAKVDALGAAIARASASDGPIESLLETLSGPAARGPLERAAESLFVVGDDFGTRCTTVLTVDADGQASFVEQRFDVGGAARGRSTFRFELGA